MQFHVDIRAILSDSTSSIGVVELGECVHILDCLGVDTDRGRLPLYRIWKRIHTHCRVPRAIRRDGRADT